MKNFVQIIDDEEDICFLLGSILKRNNYEVSSAHTLQEGMKMLEIRRPSVLFLDINLPDGSGLEALPILKKKYPSLKIIIISAYDGVKERATANEKGADLFLGKPLDRNKIESALQKIG